MLTDIKDFNFCFLHIKAVDDAGHDKSCEKKILYLEKVDQMIGIFYSLIQPNQNFITCVTGDHTTPVEIGDHTFEPVPLIMGCAQKAKNTNLELNSQSNFNEIDCAPGVLGRFPGSQVIPTLLKYKNHLENLT